MGENVSTCHWTDCQGGAPEFDPNSEVDVAAKGDGYEAVYLKDGKPRVSQSLKAKKMLLTVFRYSYMHIAFSLILQLT